MRSHARRFLLDLRQTYRWVLAVGAATFTVAVVLTYQLPFAMEAVESDVLPLQPPRDPVSFLRAIDPGDSLDVVIDQDYVPALETPGIAVLLDQLERHPDVFLGLALQLFTDDLPRTLAGDPRLFSGAASDGLVVLGAAPPFLDRAPAADEPVLLWGSLIGDVPEINDTRLGPYPVRQVSSTPPDVEFVYGTGRTLRTQDEPVVAMSVETARALGADVSTTPAEIASALTCYCPVSELQTVATAMTVAERGATTGRVYYAVGYDGLIGPLERSYAVSDVIDGLLPAAPLIAVLGLVVAAARLFWARRAQAYEIEVACGAGEPALQVRQQLLIALGLTLPAVVGFLALDAVLQSLDTPPPWPSGGGVVLLVAAVGLQLVAGTETAIRVHRLCQHNEQGERDV